MAVSTCFYFWGWFLLMVSWNNTSLRHYNCVIISSFEKISQTKKKSKKSPTDWSMDYFAGIPDGSSIISAQFFVGFLRTFSCLLLASKQDKVCCCTRYLHVWISGMMDDNFRVKTFAFGSGRSKKSSGSPSGWWIDQDDDQGLEKR